MEKISAVVGIPVIFSIAIAVLIPTVSAEAPESKATYSYAPVSGGGCQINSSLVEGEKAHFSFEVQCEDGKSSGNLHFMDHGNTAPPMLKLQSESIDTLTMFENNATFSGTARVNGTSGYNFIAYVEDNGEPGWKDPEDKFNISIIDPEGAPCYSANGTLKRGNIQIYGCVEPPMMNLPIEFDASKSYDPDGYIKVYRWDFNGDGTWDIEGNVVKVTHGYNISDNYTVILEVEDNSGNTATDSINVNISEEEGEEGISGDVTWNGSHTFEGLDDMTFIGRFQTVTATASEIINSLSSNVNVTVELRVDGVLLNWNTTTLGPDSQTNIPVFALWVPMSSGVHLVSLHVRDVSDWKYSWVGLTNDPTAGVKTFIEKVKGH